MNDLIDQYRDTRRALSRLNPDDVDKPKVNSMISEMSFVIKWMEQGFKPGPVRGIERRAGYEREICVGDKIERFPNGQMKGETISPNDMQRIDNALNCLTDRQKECFLMKYVGLLSEREIASELGIKRDTVREHLERAELKIKQENIYCPPLARLIV